MSFVEIHEFSTGIRVHELGDGRWVSGGFTGRYMHNTLEEQNREIPDEVLRAISNREFAVSEGAFTDEPAIIARDMPNWSVVAVVSRGEDEKGRSASFYRYFLCERPEEGYINGEDGISLLLEWLKEEKIKRNNQWPQFNPLEKRTQLEYELNLEAQPSMEKIVDTYRQVVVDETNPPYVADSSSILAPLVLHNVSRIVSETTHYPVAWAFRVGALEKPWSFLIICPADFESSEVIKSSIAQGPEIRTAGLVNEDELYRAIQEIISGSNIDPNDLELILNTATSEQIEDDAKKEIWRNLFDDRHGAKNAVQLGVRNSEMVRLLCLRAIILPDEALIPFLVWSGLLKNKKVAKDIDAPLAAFQYDLRLAAQKLEIEPVLEKLLQYSIVRVLFPSLVNKEIFPNTAYSLFSTRNSLWLPNVPLLIRHLIKIAREIFGKYNACDLENHALPKTIEFSNYKEWDEIDRYYSTGTAPSNYGYLIKLLILTGKGKLPIDRDDKALAYQVAAYFEQLTHGCVRKKVYNKIYPRKSKGRGKKCLNIIYIQRRLSVWGIFVNSIGRAVSRTHAFMVKDMNNYLTAFLTVFALFFGAILSATFPKTFSTLSFAPRETPNSSDSSRSSEEGEDPKAPNDASQEENWLESALEEKEGTINAVEEIIKIIYEDESLTTYPTSREFKYADETAVVQALKMILTESSSAPNFDYTAAVENGSEVDQQKLIQSVREYQQRKLLGTSGVKEGVIKMNDSTMNSLIQDLKK